MYEKLIMTKAKQFSVGMAKYYSGKQHNAASLSDAGNDITHTLPHNKCMSSPTMKPTIPMDDIWAVALPI
jgi:hypothetical protein